MFLLQSAQAEEKRLKILLKCLFLLGLGTAKELRVCGVLLGTLGRTQVEKGDATAY
jgi:hypothetical protein